MLLLLLLTFHVEKMQQPGEPSCAADDGDL
jgi:hypothetical protein